MPWTRAISGQDLIAALSVGGFRVARRDDGLVLLVRDVETVVVREEGLAEPRRVAAILERAGLTDEELEGWLAAATSTGRQTKQSGFVKRVATEEVEDAIARSRDLLRRIAFKK